MVRLRGEDECSAVRDVSKHLHRRNGRESDIMGLVGIVNVLITLPVSSVHYINYQERTSPGAGPLSVHSPVRRRPFCRDVMVTLPVKFSMVVA